MTEDKSELNKMIIQMLLHGAVGDKPSRVDPEINDNYNYGFGLTPGPPEKSAPPYYQPFRQWPPQWEKWFGRPS